MRLDVAPGTSVRVRVPASSANLGPGFDAIGLALGVYDEFAVAIGGDEVRVEVTGEGADVVPRDGDNLVLRCLAEGLAAAGLELPAGLVLSCRNVIRHGAGMGSSASAAVGGFALGSALVALARDGVAAINQDMVSASASAVEGHPDNASASALGGATLSWYDDADDVTTISLPTHPDLRAIVVVPDSTLATEKARAVLPDVVPLGAVSRTASRAGLLVEALGRRLDLLYPATEDRVFQEARRAYYPASMGLVDELRAAGHAAVISGAGPCVLVLTTAAAVDALLAWPVPDAWRVIQPAIATGGVELIEE